MEGVISISTATTTPNGHHYNDDYDNYPGQQQQVLPSLGKNSRHRHDLLAETVNDNPHGNQHNQDISIHSPSASPSPRIKHANGNAAHSTSFDLHYSNHINSDNDLEEQHEDNYNFDNQDEHESQSGMDIDTHYQNQSSDDRYRNLKRKLKAALEDNERMSLELDKFHRKVRHLRREKNLLLDRLCTLQRQGSDSGSDSASSLSSDSDSSDASLSDDSHRPPQRSGTTKLGLGGKGNGNKGGRGTGTGQQESQNAPEATTQSSHQPKKSASKGSVSISTAASTSARPGPKEPKPSAPVSVPSTITNVGSATQKPKRVHQTNKLRPGLAKARKVQPVERDADGNVKLPVTVGIITILNIGHVVYDREAFHNDRYIWPVGYKMSRSYNSMIDPNTHTTYTCSVIDDGEAPKFQIDAEDQPGKPIIAGTATGAWTHIVKAANAIRKRDHSNSASGPDYFGFSNATIAKMIQDLPNVEKCSTYVMQQFEEITGSGGSAASVSGIATGSAGQASGGNGVVGKRKASALTKAGKDQNSDTTIEGNGENENYDDDEEYTSLGSLSKPTNANGNLFLNTNQKKSKKTKLSSPVASVPSIRLAGVNDFVPVSSSQATTPSLPSANVSQPIMNNQFKVGQEANEEKISDDRSSKEQHQSNGIPPASNLITSAAGTSLIDSDKNSIDIDADIDIIDIGDDINNEEISSVSTNNRKETSDGSMSTDEDESLPKA
ncbi:hypothetical protein FBU30_004877 [Linnemannia zychae]|nr:hypothetical protein FBU30_004877 [Linnemannia zychae]